MELPRVDGAAAIGVDDLRPGGFSAGHGREQGRCREARLEEVLELAVADRALVDAGLRAHRDRELVHLARNPQGQCNAVCKLAQYFGWNPLLDA